MILSLIILSMLIGIAKARHSQFLIEEHTDWVKAGQERFHAVELITRTSLAILIGLAVSVLVHERGLDVLLNMLISFSTMHIVFDPALNILRDKDFFYASKNSNIADSIFSKYTKLWFSIEVLTLFIFIWIKIII